MLNRITALSRNIFFSLCLAGATLFPNGGYANPVEEDRRVEEVYNPKCDGNIENTPLSELEKELLQGYTKINKSKKDKVVPEKHPSGRVSIKMEDDEKGFLEPTLDFHEGVVSLDKVYVTNIDEVKGILLRDEEGNINYQVWFSYSKPTGENFQSFRRNYFVLESTIEWKGVAESLCNLSRHYRREKIEEGNQKNREEGKVEEQPKEKDSLFYLTRKEQESICTGKEVVGKEVRLLAKLSFDDCKYLPEESITGVSGLNKVKEISSSETGAILACGNADIRLPNTCQESIPYYNNFQLSFDRATSCAIYLEDHFPELGNHFIISTYPLGTYHNKRSVDLFQVTPKEVK